MSRTQQRAPRRHRQFWLDHLQRWKRSGLTKAAYCQQQNIKSGSFYNWCHIIESEIATAQGPVPNEEADLLPAQFQPVTLTTSRSVGAGLVHVQRADTDIALPSDLSPEQIQHWLSAIHRLHV